MHYGAIVTFSFISYYQASIIKEMGNVRVWPVPILHDLRYCRKTMSWWLLKPAFPWLCQECVGIP